MSKLVVLFGNGGLSDVGRHAILAALEQGNAVEKITVLTRYEELLHEPNWNCGCPEPHKYPDDPKVKVVKIGDSWKAQDLKPHVEDATGVVSCLGNRQPGFGCWESFEGNNALLEALPKEKKHRVVAITSVGVEEDWPPMEFITMAKVILSILFIVPGLSRGAYKDLTRMEQRYRATSEQDVDFLFVRPVGIGEEVLPEGKWWIQKEKYKDKLGGNMAKMDVARYMVKECLAPTRHRDAVVIGADPATLEKES